MMTLPNPQFRPIAEKKISTATAVTISGTISGSDKEQVGQIAAEIRHVKPPEPYKGKGIRYEGEYVRRKAGKAGKTMMQ